MEYPLRRTPQPILRGPFIDPDAVAKPRELARLLIEQLEPRVLLSTYYVSASGGNDANTGTTIDQPFATIQQAANRAQAGDTISIRAGTYRETVHPASSGAAGAPITFQAYGDGPVIIDGADPVTGWTPGSGSIYSASMPWTLGTGNDQVFVDQSMMTEAQWPNTGPDPLRHSFARADSIDASVSSSGLSTATIHSSAFTDPAGAWVGATIHISPGVAWLWQSGTITSSAPGVITYTYQQLTQYEVPKAGNAFYITGAFKGLDAPGEWYRDPTSGLLYLWTRGGDSPANHVVEAKARNYGFDLSGDSYINLVGLQLFACTVNTDASSTNDLLSALSAKYVSHQMINPNPWNAKYVPHTTGLLINGSSNIVENTTVTYSSGDGIYLAGSNNIVRNSTISEVDYAGGDEAGISVAGANNQVLGTTIYDAGRSGITHFFSPNTKIFYNVIHDYGVLATDCGGTYTWEDDGGGTEVAYNIIFSSLSGGYGNVGLFLDGGCTNYLLDHNLVYNVNTAIRMNYTDGNDRIFNNTLIGVDQSLNGAVPVMPQTYFVNNIMAASVLWGTGVVQYHNLNTSVGNVGFVNASASNYQLLPTSRAVDAGATLPPFTNNYLGNAPDIGALESDGVRSVPATQVSTAVLAASASVPGPNLQSAASNLSAPAAKAPPRAVAAPPSFALLNDSRGDLYITPATGVLTPNSAGDGYWFADQPLSLDRWPREFESGSALPL